MKKYRIIIPQGALPEKFEISTAQILLGYFKCDIEFLAVASAKTPDIVVNNVRWEIKSPIGDGKYNIQHQFHRAMKQSKNIIIDARRSKIDVRNIRRQLKQQVKLARGLKRLLFITKDDKVEVIK